MINFFGNKMDLFNFDFKNGVMRSPSSTPVRKTTKKKSSKSGDSGKPKKKKKKKPKPESIEASLSAETVNGDAASDPTAAVPVIPDNPVAPDNPEAPVNTAAPETFIVCCEGCNQWVSGVLFGKSRFSKWYCSDCRARRRIFSKQQRIYKEFGCGDCAACQITEDCQLCTICRLKAESKEYDHTWKCIKRRCQKIARKMHGCKHCEGCLSTEDCGTCKPCLRALESPRPVRAWKCIKRRCINKHKLKAKKTGEKKSAKGSEKPVAPSENVLPPAKKIESPSSSAKEAGPLVKKMHKKPKVKLDGKPKKLKKKNESLENTEQNRPYASRRKSRMCGECEACMQKVDCGSCDFCQDKPKFGGINRKRQKCRWRQCLRYAMGNRINRMKAVPGFYRTPVEQQISIKQGMVDGRLSQQFVQPVDTHLEQHTEFFKPTTEQQQLRQQTIGTQFSQQCIPQEFSQMRTIPGFYGPSVEQQQQQFKQEITEERFSQQCMPPKDNHVEDIPQFYNAPTEQQQIKQESMEMMIGTQQCLPSEAVYGLGPPATCQPPVPTMWCGPQQSPQPKSRGRTQEHTAEIPQKFQVMTDIPARNQSIVELKQGMMRDSSENQHAALEEQDVVCLTPAVTEQVAICRPKDANESVPLDQDVICLPQETSEHLVLCGPEEADESTPVITEIFSLGSYHSMSNLDGVLQEFLIELNELPLPAHWEVLHPAGPDLRLVQRSKLSNMSDTVIHIQPGLVYYIMVKDVPVPLQHEVFSTHPTRFRSVDDVVELICDLEAYRPCAGYQQGSNGICMSYLGARSPLCDVLVYGERCERCRVNPAALRH